MPIIATKTIIGITAVSTAISSMIGVGIVGDIEQTYIMAVDYADKKIEVAIEEIVRNELSVIESKKYSALNP